jgi:hypothetical protein
VRGWRAARGGAGTSKRDVRGDGGEGSGGGGGAGGVGVGGSGGDGGGSGKAELLTHGAACVHVRSSIAASSVALVDEAAAMMREQGVK